MERSGVIAAAYASIPCTIPPVKRLRKQTHNESKKKHYTGIDEEGKHSEQKLHTNYCRSKKLIRLRLELSVVKLENLRSDDEIARMFEKKTRIYDRCLVLHSNNKVTMYSKIRASALFKIGLELPRFWILIEPLRHSIFY